MKNLNHQGLLKAYSMFSQKTVANLLSTDCSIISAFWSVFIFPKQASNNEFPSNCVLSWSILKVSWGLNITANKLCFYSKSWALQWNSVIGFASVRHSCTPPTLIPEKYHSSRMSHAKRCKVLLAWTLIRWGRSDCVHHKCLLSKSYKPSAYLI